MPSSSKLSNEDGNANTTIKDENTEQTSAALNGSGNVERTFQTGRPCTKTDETLSKYPSLKNSESAETNYQSAEMSKQLQQFLNSVATARTYNDKCESTAINEEDETERHTDEKDGQPRRSKKKKRKLGQRPVIPRDENNETHEPALSDTLHGATQTIGLKPVQEEKMKKYTHVFKQDADEGNNSILDQRETNLEQNDDAERRKRKAERKRKKREKRRRESEQRQIEQRLTEESKTHTDDETDK